MRSDDPGEYPTSEYAERYPQFEAVRQAIRDGKSDAEIHGIAKALMVFDARPAPGKK